MIQTFNVATFFLVCFLAYTVYSETCTTTQNCQSSNVTTCNSGFHVVCQHPAGAGIVQDGGKCTCAVDDYSCNTRNDCLNLNFDAYKCISDSHKHCYDNKCICTRW